MSAGRARGREGLAPIPVPLQARSRIRTDDPLLTMEVLWPAELSGRVSEFTALVSQVPYTVRERFVSLT